MMNMVADNRITETPEFTGQFMLFPNSFGSGNVGQESLSRMSREQLAAFLKAESGNAQSAHFVTPPVEPPTRQTSARSRNGRFGIMTILCGPLSRDEWEWRSRHRARVGRRQY
jgi:hypothetical protein